MKKFKGFLESDFVVRSGFFAGVIIIAFSFLFLVLRFNQLPPELPLFYSRPWGDEQLGKPPHLFILPGGASLVLLINTYLAFRLSERELLLSRILLVSSVVVTIISFIALFKIITLIA